MEPKPDQYNCSSLVDEEAIQNLKGDRVEGCDDEGQVQGKRNHCVDQQQNLRQKKHT